MNEIDDKIATLLELPLSEQDGKMQFTEAHKELIHEISELFGNIPLVQSTKKQAEDCTKDLTAEQVYIDMLYMIVEVPTRLHMRVAARLFIPVIDRKLKGGGCDGTGE